jgi:hypothetical protein
MVTGRYTILSKRIHIPQVVAWLTCHLSRQRIGAARALHNFKPMIDKELEFSLYLSVLEVNEHSQ